MEWSKQAGVFVYYAAFTGQQRTPFFENIRYHGIEKRAEEFIKNYAETKGYVIEDNGLGKIYSLKIFIPVKKGDMLQITFWGDRDLNAGSINAEFYFKKIEEAKE